MQKRGKCSKLNDKYEWIPPSPPNRDALGWQSPWIKIDRGDVVQLDSPSVKSLESTPQGSGLQQHIIQQLDEVNKYGLFAYVYTSEGLYLLHLYKIGTSGGEDETGIGADELMRILRSGRDGFILQDHVEKAEVVDWAEVMGGEGSAADRNHGPSSFLSLKEHSDQRARQREKETSGKAMKVISSMASRVGKEPCPVLYAGELLYVKFKGLNNGAIVFWNNRSPYFLMGEDGVNNPPAGLRDYLDISLFLTAGLVEDKESGRSPLELLQSSSGSVEKTLGWEVLAKVKQWYTKRMVQDEEGGAESARVAAEEEARGLGAAARQQGIIAAIERKETFPQFVSYSANFIDRMRGEPGLLESWKNAGGTGITEDDLREIGWDSQGKPLAEADEPALHKQRLSLRKSAYSLQKNWLIVTIQSWLEDKGKGGEKEGVLNYLESKFSEMEAKLHDDPMQELLIFLIDTHFHDKEELAKSIYDKYRDTLAGDLRRLPGEAGVRVAAEETEKDVARLHKAQRLEGQTKGGGRRKKRSHTKTTHRGRTRKKKTKKRSLKNKVSRRKVSRKRISK